MVHQKYTKHRDLECAKRLLIRGGLSLQPALIDHLIRIFVSCGSLVEANEVFYQSTNASRYTWSAIISGQGKHSQAEMAYELYDRMCLSGTKRDRCVYMDVLKSLGTISAINQVRIIHDEVMETGFLPEDGVIGNVLIGIYAKCGSLKEAHKVFYKLLNQDVVSWNVMISAYALQDQGISALECFDNMRQERIEPNKVTFLSILKACAISKTLEHSRHIHEQIIATCSLGFDLVLMNTLIDAYAKCGSLKEACKVFENLLIRDVVSWNIMISAYGQHGFYLFALEFFHKMQEEGLSPNEKTFSIALKACGSMLSIHQSRYIHEHIIRLGFQDNVIAGSMLLNAYAESGNLQEACLVFDKFPKQNLALWNAMISGYISHEDEFPALDYFEEMHTVGLKANDVTFSNVLRLCGNIGIIERGRCIHLQIMDVELQHNVHMGSALVDMYAKCGSLMEAYKTFVELPFRDVVCWGAMIAGYAQNSEGHLSLKCFENMQCEGVKPNEIIFSSILSACGNTGDLERGRQIHQQIIEVQVDAALGSALVDMYAKCGCLEEAREIFDNLPKENMIVWNALIAGYTQHGEGQLALECFDNMESHGLKPNSVTYSSVLKACGSIGAIEQGRHIHKQVITRFQSDAVLGSALVDMYAKCGSLKEAQSVFKQLLNPDVVCWGALISGYAQCADIGLAMQCFEDMKEGLIMPSDLIFSSILAACGHSGMVEKGWKYLSCMREDYGMIPNKHHINCMIDILSRAGYLSEAHYLLQTTKPDIIALTSLLTACRTYGNIELGRQCFDKAVQLEPHHASSYVLMSGIYSDAFLWSDTAYVEELRQNAGAWKKPAKAWIEINNKVTEFVVEDKNHPQREEIYGVLKKLNNKMKLMGYAPNVDLVMQQRTDTEKEDALCGHSEKLAIAFGLISTPSGTTIRTTKNLRVCLDCHSTTKLISKIENREIVIKDAYRMHHFKDGACACGDYL